MLFSMHGIRMNVACRLHNKRNVVSYMTTTKQLIRKMMLIIIIVAISTNNNDSLFFSLCIDYSC